MACFPRDVVRDRRASSESANSSQPLSQPQLTATPAKGRMLLCPGIYLVGCKWLQHAQITF